MQNPRTTHIYVLFMLHALQNHFSLMHNTFAQHITDVSWFQLDHIAFVSIACRHAHTHTQTHIHTKTCCDMYSIYREPRTKRDYLRTIERTCRKKERREKYSSTPLKQQSTHQCFTSSICKNCRRHALHKRRT